MEWLTACYRIHYSSVYTHTRTHTWCPIEEAKQAHIFIPKTTNPQASWRTNTSVDISLVVRIMVRWDLFATADKTSQPMSVSTQRVCDLDMELDTKSQEDPPNSTIAKTERRRQGGRDPARGRGFLPTRSIPTSATAGQGGAWEVESDHEQLSQGMERVEWMEIDPIPLLWSLDRTKPTNQLTKPSALTCLAKSEATQLTSVGIADTKLMTEIILTKYRVNCLLGMGKQVINLKCMPIQSTKASTIPSNIVTNICNMLC